MECWMILTNSLWWNPRIDSVNYRAEPSHIQLFALIRFFFTRSCQDWQNAYLNCFFSPLDRFSKHYSKANRIILPNLKILFQRLFNHYLWHYRRKRWTMIFPRFFHIFIQINSTTSFNWSSSSRWISQISSTFTSRSTRFDQVRHVLFLLFSPFDHVKLGCSRTQHRVGGVFLQLAPTLKPIFEAYCSQHARTLYLLNHQKYHRVLRTIIDLILLSSLLEIESSLLLQKLIRPRIPINFMHKRFGVYLYHWID